jgi:hypothetical protein
VGEAAKVLGLSDDAFRAHVAGDLKWIRKGAVKLVSVRELERWISANEAHALDEKAVSRSLEIEERRTL